MSESTDIMLDVAKKSENIAPDLFFTHNGNENDEDELELIKIELYSDFEDEDGKSNDKNSLEKDPIQIVKYLISSKIQELKFQ